MPQVSVKFLGGVVKADDVARLKTGDVPHIVFAGRSNVGKSSLLNALTGTKIARVSQEPGKTREMNFFAWGLTRSPKDACVLVDLPGYGYAKVAAELKKQWGNEITKWLKSDERIAMVVALADGRHGFLKNDVELVELLKELGVPFLVAFTKMDKWKSANQKRNAERELKQVAQKLGVPGFVYVSAQEREGVTPLFKALKQALLGEGGGGESNEKEV